MRTWSSVRTALLVFLAALLGGIAAAAADTAAASVGYAAQLATAKSLAAEKSWAKAHEAYAAALTLAPDAEAKRWCELGRVDAGWREEGNNARNEVLLARISEFESLLERYQKPGTEKDTFWFAAMESWASFRAIHEGLSYLGAFVRENLEYQKEYRRREGGAPVEEQVASRFLDLASPYDTDRLTICEALGEQRPTVEARHRYLEAVRVLVIDPDRQWDTRVIGRLVEQVRTASRLAESADDRAWFALVAQLLRGPQADPNATKAEQWRETLAFAKGTRWETLAGAAEVYWRVSNGWAPECEPGAAVDMPARVAECDKVLGRLASELGLKWPPTESGDSITWPFHPADDSLAWAVLVFSGLVQWRVECDQVALQLSMPRRFKTGQPVSGFFGATAAERIDFSLEQLTAEQWLVANQYSRKAEIEASRGLVVREWSQELGESRNLPFRSGEVAVASELPAGFYVLYGRAHQRAASVLMSCRFMVSGGDMVLLVSTQGPDVLNCCKAGAIAPLAGKIVRGFLGDPAGRESAIPFNGMTDESGRSELQYEGALTKAHEMVVGWVGDNPVSLERRDVVTYSRDSHFQADVVLDRDLYRPGETVRWKMILREQRDGRSAVPARDTKLRVSVNVGQTELIKETELTLSAFGTVAGEVPLPKTLAPGYGEISFTEGAAAAKDRLHGGSSQFRVEHYRPPAVRVAVELASVPDSLRPGAEVAVRVAASYLSGGGVMGAPVRCRITSYKAMDAKEEFRYGGSNSNRTARMEPEMKALVGTTDDSGSAVFRYRLPDSATGRVSVIATILPAGTAEITERESWAVTKVGYLCGADHNQIPDAVTVGSLIEFRGFVTDGTRRPTTFAGQAQVVERRWQEVWRFPDGRIVTGPESAAWSDPAPMEDGDEDETGRQILAPNAPKRLHAGYHDTVVAEVPIRTGADGQLVVPFTPAHAGIYTLCVWHDGEVVSADGGPWPQVIACDDATTDLALPYTTSAAHVLDHSAAGRALRAMVVLPEGKKRGWLVVNTAKRAVAQPFVLKGRAGIVEFEDGASPDEDCNIAVYPEGREDGAFPFFSIHSGDKPAKLEVGIVADGVCRPGDPVKVCLHASPSSSDQTPAEVWVNVVDEAVVGLTKPQEWRRSARDFRPMVEGGSRLCREPREPVEARMPSDLRRGVRSADPLGKTPQRRFSQRRSLADYSSLSLWPEVHAPIVLSRAMGCFSMGGAGMPRSIAVRTRFDATAFWAPAVITDAKGEATVSFKYPDNLTQWRIEAYAVGADGNSFGTATAFTRTSLPFQARLNLPRFLVAGDRAAPSATLVNRTDVPLEANAELAVGGVVTSVGAPGDGARASQAAPLRVDGVAVPAQGEAQAGWAVRAEKSGTAEFTLKAWTGVESDGMVLKVPVLEDGILQETAASGRLARGEAKRELSLALPEPLDPARTMARVHLSGSHAAAMLDALPYLVDYPYGCVEQTMSRFLPAVIAKRTLGELGFDAAAVESRILGRESEADAARRAKTAGLARLDEVIEKSLARLLEAQRHDGGFGWWPQATQTDLWMTAYVAWGLELARGAGAPVSERMIESTSSALLAALAEKSCNWDQPGRADGRVWALAALAIARLGEREAKQRAEAWAQCYAARGNLTPSGRACLALAAAKLGTAEERAVLLRNLENGLEHDAATDYGELVHWGSTGGHWRASDGAVESTALTLLALLELEPQHALVEPAMNWLVLNRRSGRWESTRATAFAVLALSRVVQVRGEAQGETEIEVLANGAPVGRVKLNRETLLAGATVLELPLAKLRGGQNRVALRRVSGDGPVYAMALAQSWAMGETVKPAGHQAEVERGFVRQKATATLIGTLRIDPQALPSGGAATAGEEVQAVVTVTVPNELEYVMVAVPKPAGCEPLNPLSGWDARIRRVNADGGHSLIRSEGGEAPSLPRQAEGRAIYREEADDKSVFFLDRLEAGTWEIRFGMRAVTPGDFRALPVQLEAMYVPEIRANSDAQRVRIEARAAVR